MKTIGIVSLKGGVGKTSSVVALGAAIASFGKKVLLVDGNFSAPNLGLHLDIVEPEHTIHDALNRKKNISDIIYSLKHFDVIPASIFNREAFNPLKLKDTLKQVKNKYDYVIIDSSPALNEETLATMLASDRLLVVTTPDLPTLGMTLKSLKLAKHKKIPISGLILNKVHNKNFEISLSDIEKTAEVPVMAVVPHDVNILKSLSKSMPSVFYKPKSASSQEYFKLASALIGEEYKPKRWRDWLMKLTPNRQTINREIYYETVFN